MFDREAPAKPFKLIYDSGEFGKQEFDFATCPEAMLWNRQNPPGPLVQRIHLKNFTHYNVFVPEIQVNGRALFLDNIVGYSYRNESFSQEAYNKVMADREWDKIYFKKTGKHWQGHEEHKDDAKTPRDAESTGAPLDHAASLGILGLKPGFSKESLKTAYRNTVNMNHPDKVPQHLSKEFIELAERRTKQINQAYELLKRTFN